MENQKWLIIGNAIVNPAQIKTVTRDGDEVLITLGANVRVSVLDGNGTLWDALASNAEPVAGFDKFTTKVNDEPEQRFGHND